MKDTINYNNQWLYIPYSYENNHNSDNNYTLLVDVINAAIKKHDKKNNTLIIEGLYYPKNLDEKGFYLKLNKLNKTISDDLKYIYKLKYDMLDVRCDNKGGVKSVKYRFRLINTYLGKIQSPKPVDLITHCNDDSKSHYMWCQANFRLTISNGNKEFIDNGQDIEFDEYIYKKLTPEIVDEYNDEYVECYDRLSVINRNENENYLKLTVRIKNEKFRPKAKNVFEKIKYKLHDLIKSNKID